MKTQQYIATLAGLTAAIGVALADEVRVAPAAALTPTAALPPPARRAARPPHWAYQPIGHYEAPAVERRGWVLTPVDAFVLEKLEAANLAPSPDADRATFARRATLDVLGVIPRPEDVAAFVADRSPGRVREVRRRPARIAAVRRAPSAPLARPRALRRQHRLRRRPDARRDVPLPRLRRRRLQFGQAVRRLHQGADRRRRDRPTRPKRR